MGPPPTSSQAPKTYHPRFSYNKKNLIPLVLISNLFLSLHCSSFSSLSCSICSTIRCSTTRSSPSWGYLKPCAAACSCGHARTMKGTVHYCRSALALCGIPAASSELEKWQWRCCVGAASVDV